MANTSRVGLAALAILVGCTGGNGGNGGDDSGEDDGCIEDAPSFELGTGDFDYLAISPGDPLTMWHGPQGGWHFDAGGQVSGSSLELTILPTVTLTGSGLQLAGDQDTWFAALEEYVPETCVGYFWGKRAFIDDHLPGIDYQEFICSLEGEEVEMCVEIRDVETSGTSTECEVGIAVLDPADEPLCEG